MTTGCIAAFALVLGTAIARFFGFADFIGELSTTILTLAFVIK
jgi:hypothetical protein